MRANAIETLREAYTQDVQFAHLCNGKCPDSDSRDPGRDPDCLACRMLDALPAVEALLEAAKPWAEAEAWRTSTGMKVKPPSLGPKERVALAAAVRRVETGQ